MPAPIPIPIFEPVDRPAPTLESKSPTGKPTIRPTIRPITSTVASHLINHISHNACHGTQWSVGRLDSGSFCVLRTKLSGSGPGDIPERAETGLTSSTAFADGACWDFRDLVVDTVFCKPADLGSFCALGAQLSGYCHPGDVSASAETAWMSSTEPLPRAIVG